MKSTGTIQAGTGLWNEPNTGAINSSSFTSLPGGYRDDEGLFFSLRNSATFWSSTVYYSWPGTSWGRLLSFDDASISRYLGHGQASAFSGRCLKD